MTESPHVNVHVQSGAGEVVRLVATMMLVGGAMSVAWAVAHTGYAELAGSGLAVMLVTAAKLLWKRGMIAVPERTGADGLAETRSAMKRLTAEWGAYLSRASVPAIVLLSIGYAVAFLALRAGVIRALTVFSNPWIAGGVGAIAGAFLVAPRLFPSIAAAMKSRPSPAPSPGPSPAPPVQPTSPAPAPAAPAAPTAPTIVRLKKKEN